MRQEIIVRIPCFIATGFKVRDNGMSAERQRQNVTLAKVKSCLKKYEFAGMQLYTPHNDKRQVMTEEYLLSRGFDTTILPQGTLVFWDIEKTKRSKFEYMLKFTIALPYRHEQKEDIVTLIDEQFNNVLTSRLSWDMRLHASVDKHGRQDYDRMKHMTLFTDTNYDTVISNDYDKLREDGCSVGSIRAGKSCVDIEGSKGQNELGKRQMYGPYGEYRYGYAGGLDAMGLRRDIARVGKSIADLRQELRALGDDATNEQRQSIAKQLTEASRQAAFAQKTKRNRGN
jgi:hypothetical protein